MARQFIWRSKFTKSRRMTNQKVKNNVTLPNWADPETVRWWYRDNETIFSEFVKIGPTAEVSSHPIINAFIEPVDACNMAWSFSVTSYETRTRQVMPVKLFRKFVDELREDEILPSLTFAGEGEPFLHKQATDIVEYAKSAEFKSGIDSSKVKSWDWKYFQAYYQ